MKIPSSNLGRTCCVQKLFLTFRTIFVHNMFSPCSGEKRASGKNLPVPTVKVRWRFRKILWPSQNIWTLCFKFDFKILVQQCISTTVSWVLHPRITTYIRQHKWRRYMTFCSSPIYFSPCSFSFGHLREQICSNCFIRYIQNRLESSSYFHDVNSQMNHFCTWYICTSLVFPTHYIWSYHHTM